MRRGLCECLGYCCCRHHLRCCCRPRLLRCCSRRLLEGQGRCGCMVILSPTWRRRRRYATCFYMRSRRGLFLTAGAVRLAPASGLLALPGLICISQARGDKPVLVPSDFRKSTVARCAVRFGTMPVTSSCERCVCKNFATSTAGTVVSSSGLVARPLDKFGSSRRAIRVPCRRPGWLCLTECC